MNDLKLAFRQLLKNPGFVPSVGRPNPTREHRCQSASRGMDN